MSRTNPTGLKPPLPAGLALATTSLIVTGLAIAGSLAAIAPAHADKVGVAAAVHPDAFSSLNGGAQSQVNLGKSIFFNERINTTGAGLVQVLLVDGSTFTVGPGSDLVIDKFVYDPNKGKGEVVASFGKGVMRFVGGKISKNDGGVTVNTPEGALSIRGGMFQGKIDKSGTVFSFLFGEYLKLGNQKIFTPGYSFYFNHGSPTIEPTRPEDTAFIMGKLVGGGKAYVINNNTPPSNTFVPQHHISTAEITQEGQQTLIQGNIQNDEANNHHNPPPPPPPPCQGDTAGCGQTPGTHDVRALSSPSFFTAFSGSPQQTDINAPEDYPGNHGILGGSQPITDQNGDKVKDTISDFTTTLSPPDNEGRVIGAFAGVATGVDYENDSLQTFSAHINGTINLPGDFSNADCDDFGACTLKVTDGSLTGQISGGPADGQNLTVTLRGSAVASGDGFVAYQLFPAFPGEEGPSNHLLRTNLSSLDVSGGFQSCDGDCSPDLTFAQHVDLVQGLRELIGFAEGVDLNNPMLIFGGNKFAMGESGQVREFELMSDPRQSISFAPFGGDGPTLQNFVVPFATLESSPLLATSDDASVSQLALLEKDKGDPQSRAVWLQTSLLIKGYGTSQESEVVVALGEMKNENGTPGLVGERRGGSSIDLNPLNNWEPNQTQVSFTGGVATLDSPNGHFLGDTQPNIVIGADSTGNGHNIFLDKPLSTDPNDGYAGASYHVGIGSTTTSTPTQTSGTYTGYAAAVFRQAGGGSDDEGQLQAGPCEDCQDTGSHDHQGGVLMSQSPNEMTITFNKRQNTLSATIITHVVSDGSGDGSSDQGGMTLSLGDPNSKSHGRSAFIDDSHYAAIETPGQTTIQDGHDGTTTTVTPSSATGYLVSGEQLGVTKFFPRYFGRTEDGSAPGFCNNCDFIKWGAWGATVSFQDHGGSDTAVNAHLGWWVAGKVIDSNDMPQDGTASYSGHAIGTVANNLNGQGWKTYVAAGNMGMDWNFESRTGTLSITHFDPTAVRGGLNFEGDMAVPGELRNGFNGPLTVTNSRLPYNLQDLAGTAQGSFVAGPGQIKGSIPAGVIGNWNVGNNHYNVGGIFAGSGASR